jgi:hypothetical protein
MQRTALRALKIAAFLKVRNQLDRITDLAVRRR